MMKTVELVVQSVARCCYLAMMQMMDLMVLSVAPAIAAVAAAPSILIIISGSRFEHDAAALAVVRRMMRMTMRLLLLNAVDED